MKTLITHIALAFILIANTAYATDLDDQWFKGKVVVKATHFASEVEGEDTVLLDPAPMKSLKAVFWMHLEKAGDDGAYISSIYADVGEGGLSLIAETQVLVLGNAFVGLSVPLPVTEKKDGELVKVGVLGLELCGRAKIKVKKGELVKASLTSLGGTMPEGAITLTKGTKALLVGGAKLKALRVAPEKVPTIL